jgi:hypothetical protein
VSEESQSAPQAQPLGRREILILASAWLVPGSGHFLLGRRVVAVAFLAIIAIAIATGVSLDGNLYRVDPQRPLTFLATLASIGMGAAYFVLRFGLGYAGRVVAAGYEYGTAFLLTGGLMNLLLLLDVWDLLKGERS